MGTSVKDSDASAEMEAFARLLAGYEQARNEGLAPINPALEEFLNAKRLHESCENEDIRIPGLNDDKSEAKALEIVPQAFYFVKVHDSQGQKYFINMCGCPEVSAPGEWQDGVPAELEEKFTKQESELDDATQNVRFSLSCSDHVLAPDNRGTMCKVYDVVFNLLVMQQSMIHKQLRTFVINMAISWISQKYNIELSDDFRVPKGKYKGDHVRTHRIRAPKTQLVCEIPDVQAELEPSFPLILGKELKHSKGLCMEDKMLKPAKSLTADIRHDLEYIETENLISNAQSAASIETECEQSISSMDRVQHGTTESMSLTGCTKDEAVESISQSDYSKYETVESISQSNYSINETVENISQSDSPKDEAEKKMSSTEYVNDETIKYVESTTKKMPTTTCNQPTIVEDLTPQSSCDSTIISQGNKIAPSTQFSPSTPQFQFTYIGRPVELVILNITLPSTIPLQNLEVLVSDNQVFVESDAREIITIPLVFSTTANDVKASFYNLDNILELYLPFTSYNEVLTRSDRFM